MVEIEGWMRVEYLLDGMVMRCLLGGEVDGVSEKKGGDISIFLLLLWIKSCSCGISE